VAQQKSSSFRFPLFQKYFQTSRPESSHTHSAVCVPAVPHGRTSIQPRCNVSGPFHAPTKSHSHTRSRRQIYPWRAWRHTHTHTQEKIKRFYFGHKEDVCENDLNISNAFTGWAVRSLGARFLLLPPDARDFRRRVRHFRAFAVRVVHFDVKFDQNHSVTAYTRSIIGIHQAQKRFWSSGRYFCDCVCR
jgi:hypothetical protein